MLGGESLIMNLKFIEGGKAGYKVVEFGGVGVAYKEVVYRIQGDRVRRGGSSVQGSRLQ